MLAPVIVAEVSLKTVSTSLIKKKKKGFTHTAKQEARTLVSIGRFLLNQNNVFLHEMFCELRTSLSNATCNTNTEFNGLSVSTNSVTGALHRN